MPEYDLRKRTKHFALRIIKLYSALPKTTEAQVIGKQFLRSGTSVGANYREAYRAESGVMPENKLASLLDETNQLIAIFTTTVKKRKG